MRPLFYIVTFFAISFLTNCKEQDSSEKTSHWYDSWLNSPTDELHQELHSEIELASGAKISLSFETSQPLIIGYYVRDGYEVTKDEGTIYMGSPTNPRMIGASPGTSQTFTAKEGVIKVIFENTSSINTSIAIYSSKSNKPKM